MPMRRLAMNDPLLGLEEANARAAARLPDAKRRLRRCAPLCPPYNMGLLSPVKQRGNPMALSVKPSGAALGAEIGFDLSRGMDERQFREIEAAFHDNIVVVFRGQALSNARHIEFS